MDGECDSVSTGSGGEISSDAVVSGGWVTIAGGASEGAGGGSVTSAVMAGFDRGGDGADTAGA